MVFHLTADGELKGCNFKCGGFVEALGAIRARSYLTGHISHNGGIGFTLNSLIIR